ncbi:universal stress protein [Streptomyces sp. NPDC002054]|uniref:universal stress protein n=1 Tax=Streptomyces sp. NPDC002054 TaxID=3154663 RepID=UPI00332EE599
MKSHVTVGVDGSPESRAAARWAAQEAVLRQVPLRLVHAVDWPLDPVFPGLGRQDVDRWADQALTEAAQELHGRHPNLEITTRCLTARPAAALAAEAADAGLLVLGSRGLGGLVGFIVGSVATATVVATDTPVVLVRVADDPDNERDIGRSVTRMVDDMLLPWHHKFPDVNVSHNVFMGSAGEHLVRASQGAGLVVVGRHVRRSPLGVHLGSVAHAVLHHAAAPVAVIAHG